MNKIINKMSENAIMEIFMIIFVIGPIMIGMAIVGSILDQLPINNSNKLVVLLLSSCIIYYTWIQVINGKILIEPFLRSVVLFLCIVWTLMDIYENYQVENPI
jgi:predicted TIM-barrel enzyme